MPRMPKARLRVATPLGEDFRPNGGSITIDFKNGDQDTQLAKDITDAMRAKGYHCKLSIDKEITEEY